MAMVCIGHVAFSVVCVVHSAYPMSSFSFGKIILLNPEHTTMHNWQLWREAKIGLELN